MKGFLDEVAEYLVKQHNSEDLQNMIMVLPSKRGGIYLKKALARVFPTPLISPVIYSLEEFVLIATESELMGPTDLLLEAYSCFKAVEPNLELDKFMGWGPIMLKDFDTLDMYLVPPKDLFDYLSEAKSIDRWAEELGTEDKAELITPNTQAYFKLHENLLEVYARLQSRLKDKKQFYRGQLFRKLVKNLVEGKKLPMDFSKLYFLGFNALSKSEEEIIRRILATTNAEILWDADSYYVNDPYHRAGFWLRNYANPRKKEFLAKNEFLWLGENYQNQEKEVSIVKVKNTSTQVYWAINKILEWEKNYGKEEDIALVLGDEQLLGSFLDYLGYFQDRLNITMGYPLRKTHIFNLLEDFWEMLISKDPGRFDRGLVDKVLKNPLLRVYLNLKDWDNQNLNEFPLYIPEEKLSQLSKEIPIFLYLFPEKTIGFREILISLGKLCYELIKVLPENSMKEQVEAIFMVKESLEKIAISFEGQELSDLKVGRSFLRQYLSGLKLSFEGQVKRTLNVMGLLETRTLDFDRVIILSVNEEILPRSSSRDSLIPYDIATMKAFDLPTRTQADAV
ncbi:MAG: hypothetical protein RIR51_1204, partial [Bacteroidota bacterium]